MKNWTESEDSYIDGKRIKLDTGDCESNRVISITKTKNNKVIFREKCDSYYTAEFTKEEAIEVLYEAINWLKQND